MNTNHLVTIANEMAKQYIKNPKVAAVLLAGSVSRGICDEYSDIELHLFWHEEPTDHDRLFTITQVDGKIISFDDYEEQEWSEVYEVNGTNIEISSFLVSTIETYIQDVVISSDTNIDKQCILASIEDGIVLEGADLIHRFKEKLKVYPVALKEAMVKNALTFSSRWTARYALIARDDFYMFEQVVIDAVNKLLQVLHGLNGIYVAHPAFKWLQYTVDKMKLKPEKLIPRIKHIIYSEPNIGLVELEKLLYEVLQLIEKEMPSININFYEIELLQKRRGSDGKDR